MSLQVWLPFIKGLTNQGISSLSSITLASGNSLTANGKLGGQAITLTKLQTILPTLSSMTGAKEMSYAFWVKVNTAWEAQWLDGIRWISTDGSTTHTSRQEFYTNCTKVGTWFQGGSISGKDFTPEVWTHIAGTFNYNTGEVKFYLNGILQGTSTALATTHYCRGDFYIGDNGVDLSENDIRIYDHCLSDKEVEEIAKGLVLHYKLDMVEQDYSTNLVTSLTSGGQTTVDGNKIITSGTNADTYFTINLSESIVNGTSYIISCDAIVPEGTCWTFPLGKQANTILSFQIFNGHNVFPFTANDIEWGTNRIFMDDGGSPNSARSTGVSTELFNFCVTKVGFIQDTSGYNNNGTIVGNIQLDTNIIKYSHSIKKINGQYIRVDKRPAECMPKDAITVNLWQYATSWYNPISCTEGGGWNFENSSGIRFPVYISGVGYKVAQSSITPASTLNSWHMLTGTMDKDNIKIYYDGQEVGTVANGSTNGIGYANNYIFIGGEAQGNSTSPASSAYVGNLSDVRIYATALTAEQIKELYNTSATIDNKGNIYARELVEI